LLESTHMRFTNDPDYYEILFNYTSHLDEDPKFVRQLGSSQNIQNTRRSATTRARPPDEPVP
jgi:hypothetical protein